MPLQQARSLTTMRSRRVVCLDGVQPAAVHVANGRIAKVTTYDDLLRGVDLQDFGDRILMPGLVDTHVHIDEPGRTDWEGFRHATSAAAAGGYTTLVDMPLNCCPATTTLEALRLKAEAASNACFVDYGFWGGIVPGNAAEVSRLIEHGVLGFKCFLSPAGIDGFERVTVHDLEAVMSLLTEAGVPLLVHCESPALLEEAKRAIDADPTADWRRYSTYLASRPSEAEREAISMMIRLCSKFGSPVHVVHLASGDAIPALRRARREGLPISVETCPHYLAFCAEDIPDGATLYKCAPPIRSRAQRARVWQALLEGDIDLIATDHSPCPPAMKDLECGSFLEAWGGISSLQLALPIVWTEARHRKIGIADVVRWMAERPAVLAGLAGRKGAIAEGCDADVVVFDPDGLTRVDPGALYHRHQLTPYAGQVLSGRIEATFLRGELVFEHSMIVGGPRGRRCVRMPAQLLKSSHEQQT